MNGTTNPISNFAIIAGKVNYTFSQDLTVVEALVKEHLEFHDELSQKNRDVDRLTKLSMTTRDGRRLLGTNYGR